MPYEEVDIETQPFTDGSGTNSTPTSRGGGFPPLNAERAQHIINKFTEDPSWLANPRTSKAANAIFAAASKVVGMQVQLEAANNQSFAAKNKNQFASEKIKGLSEVSQYVPPGDVVGQTELGRLNGMVGSPDFNLEAFANGVSKLQSTYKKPDVLSDGSSNRPVADTLTFADGKTVNVVYGPSGAPTVIRDGKEADDTYMKALQDVAKADLLDARKAVHKATGVDKREQALNGYYSAKRNFDSVFRAIKTPQTQSTNAPAASTNAPTAVAPPSGLAEGQRVRNRVTGKMGTVKNGVVVPDPELEPAE